MNLVCTTQQVEATSLADQSPCYKIWAKKLWWHYQQMLSTFAGRLYCSSEPHPRKALSLTSIRETLGILIWPCPCQQHTYTQGFTCSYTCIPPLSTYKDLKVQKFSFLLTLFIFSSFYPLTGLISCSGISLIYDWMGYKNFYKYFKCSWGNWTGYVQFSPLSS